MALDKVPLLLVTFASYYVAATAPNPPAAPQEISRYPPGDRLLSSFAPAIWEAVKRLLLLVVFCEIITLVSIHYSASVLSQTILSVLLRAPIHKSASPSVTPVFILSLFLLVWGGYMRWASYRALGRLYTYEVSIRDHHKLVTTGPYSVIRHPGYIGSAVASTGILLCAFGPGSWMLECGWLDLLWAKIFAALVIAFKVFCHFQFIRRTSAEDKMMRAQFGAQWDEWAKNVPYKLVPGIF
ncbi:hypothetical protein BDP27DRAFT_1290836 [Rhodocollybia butyracea]|uniref:Protein-S-isoprenylcysteine O-methyltransferase n=1 Tax=Rhodocollybia butyracea TaxID=206335 RepID=A0A9P5U9I0_9AGAR|nr:hypothetical protein BDP27DRAFT_1290836 [Rhodocollybia butyracea]